jgi:hypothetical protein
VTLLLLQEPETDGEQGMGEVKMAFRELYDAAFRRPFWYLMKVQIHENPCFISMWDRLIPIPKFLSMLVLMKVLRFYSDSSFVAAVYFKARDTSVEPTD